MALGTRAISRLPASSGSGVSGAKKLADLYASTHTNSAGEISDPDVYAHIINNILAPVAGTVDGQNAIADYNNKYKQLLQKQSDVETNQAGLKLNEYNAWYMDEDADDAVSFRNPAYVARGTSESLDILVAQTLATIEEQKARKVSTAESEKYLSDLLIRADRMRTFTDSLNDGVAQDVEGYGYYVETDPNTGKVRGASLMPTDAAFEDLGSGKIRTDSFVTVGNKRVPLYVNAIKTADGTMKAMFGGKEYTGDDKLLTGGDEDVVLTDRNTFQSGGPAFELGKVYRTFSGRTNIDGSPKQQYYYIGFDNKKYSFSDDDAQGKALLSSLQSVGAFSDVSQIPRISPTAMRDIATNTLPADNPNFAARQGTMTRYVREGAAAEAESQRLNNRGAMQMLSDEWDAAMARKAEDPYANIKAVAQGAENLVKGAASGIASFFGRKNRVPAPADPAASRGGQYSAPDVLEAGRSFFEGR